MSIKDWAASERPREKLLERGASALSDAELLAILLRVGTQGMSAVDLSRSLLDAYGGLGSVMHASAAETQGHGLGGLCPVCHRAGNWAARAGRGIAPSLAVEHATSGGRLFAFAYWT